MLFRSEGKDVLYGGADADTFIYEVGDSDDTVMDFEIGVDVIDLTSFGTSFGALNMYDDGSGNTIVHFDVGQDLTIAGVASADLSSGDFLF